MQNFFKRTMYDMHSHILPFLDDGPQTMMEAVEMARMAAENGTTVMVATPHANQRGRFENYDAGRLQDIYEVFLRQLEREQILLTVLPGMEIFASEDMVEQIKARRLCSLADTCYFLVEFSIRASGKEIEALLQRMLWEQMVPVIAHPERYLCVQHNPEILHRWRSMGCYMQLDKGSVLGSFGSHTAHTARRMLDWGIADVIGSDTHGIHLRTPELQRIRHYLTHHYCESIAKTLLEENPKCLIQNKPCLRFAP